jgi:retinol-binding protein 3
MYQLKLKTAIPVILLALLSFSTTKAQEPLAKSMVDSTVIKLGNLMADYYILKDKGEAANKMLNSNLKRKKYYSLNGGVLANTLVEDLQALVNDKHLMIKFYPNGNAATEDLAQEKNKNDEYKPDELSLKRSRIQNYGFKEVAILNMNIGYLKMDGFHDIRNSESAKAAAAAMDFLSHTSGLIIDLSENTGGDPATLQFLISYFFKVEPPTHYNTFHFRDGHDNYLEERTLPYLPGERLSKIPLYVLTGKNTFSAGEALAYSLKHLNRATIVGQTTGGGAHAADFKLINDYFDMSIPMARAINPITKTNWEGVGVKPDIEIELMKAKDYAHAELIKIAMKQESDEILLGRYKWQLEEVECRLSEFSHKIILLERYIGSFDGDRKIFIENGKLKYQRGQGKIATLTALNETCFTSDTFSDLRIEYDLDGETILGLKFYNEFGQYYLAKKLNP